MAGTQKSEPISTKQLRIAEITRKFPTSALKTLAHHIDLDWLREAHRRTRKGGAPGIDRQTAADYAVDLDSNLQSLLDRAKSGDRYRAPPVKRAYIPKGKGELRPLGIPTFEDKVLQRAVAMVLESVYEQEFLPCSYGFRPGRSPLQAVMAVNKTLVGMRRRCTVLELDICQFFDTVDHDMLRKILCERIGDGVLIRLIGKWLKAGVIEQGRHLNPEIGTPQGGVISPLLANIYLHTVFDLWFMRDVLPRMRGKAHMVRFADDVVMFFEHEGDAERVMAVLGKRAARFGLKLHPDKTRLVPFRRPWPEEKRDRRKAGTFDFLGFTFYWGQTRAGKWMPMMKTSSARLRRAVATANTWLREVRFWKVSVQYAHLRVKLLGHFRYFGISGNSRSLQYFRWRVNYLWRRWLLRRSHRRNVTYVGTLLNVHYRLPPARIYHGFAKQIQ